MRKKPVFNPDTDQRTVFFIEIYPETTSYDVGSVLSACQSFPKYAYILHDSDTKEDGTLKKAHIHCVVSTDKSPVLISTVSNRIGVPAQFIQVDHSFKWCVRYLCHKDDPDKFPYNPSDIVTNLGNIMEYFRTDNEGDIVLQILDYMNSPHVSWMDIYRFACSINAYDVFRRNLGVLKLIRDEGSFSNTK